MTRDALAINTIRTLAADVVQKANSGHPGAPMGCAPMAHLLFSRFIKFNPANPTWINRDRFVLSNGHACVLQYVLLHLLGSPGMPMQELQSFRQLGSRTPGHPENFVTPGIEVTTGPLGQGVSAAVGLALAQQHLAAYFNRPGFDLFTNFTFTIVGDGCLQEGVSAEACSLAGHLRLGHLIVLYDDNHITIDGDTSISFTEDVLKRFEAYGWHTLSVENGDDTSDAALANIVNAIETAKNVVDKPSIIKIRTTIGFGSAKAGSDKVHGAPLGAEDLAHAKKSLGFDPSVSFHVPEEVYAYYRSIVAQSSAEESTWNELFSRYIQAFPNEAADLKRRIEGKLPEGLLAALPRYTPNDPPTATRKLSENVINALAPSVLPEFIGGSADLTSSNLTRWKDAIDFQHPDTKAGSYDGRYIRFGVREHGMAAICNGICAYGLLTPFCSTFLNFISYALGAVRLSALSHANVIYIMTHDSIGLGEDGPTHQPVETLASLRALPNMLVFRPADGNETSGAYLAALTNRSRPSVLALSRQNLPHLAASSPEAVLQGAYVIHEARDASSSSQQQQPQICIVATGSEVSLAIDAANVLACERNIPVRVVSMPCGEIFDEQPYEYRVSVFPVNIPILSVEALSVFGWERYSHAHIGMRSFGASAPLKQVYEKFGITVNAIVEKSVILCHHFATVAPPNKMMRL